MRKSLSIVIAALSLGSCIATPRLALRNGTVIHECR